MNVAQVVGYARPVSDSPPLPPSGGSWSDNSDSLVDIPRQSRPARHSGRVDPAYSTRTAARRNPGTNPRRVPQDQADGIPDLSEQVTILRRYAGNTGTYSTVYRGTYRGHEVRVCPFLSWFLKPVRLQLKSSGEEGIRNPHAG